MIDPGASALTEPSFIGENRSPFLAASVSSHVNAVVGALSGKQAAAKPAAWCELEQADFCVYASRKDRYGNKVSDRLISVAGSSVFSLRSSVFGRPKTEH